MSEFWRHWRTGQQIRVIQMDGCMAHIRNYNPVWRGRIVGIIPNAGYAMLMVEDMSRPGVHRLYTADPRQWVNHLGIMEYQV